MGTAKYDWQKIKLNYFESDIIEVKGFLMAVMGLDNKTASNSFWKLKTLNWRSEKEEILKSQIEKTKEQLLSENPELRIDLTKLLKAKQDIIQLVVDGLNEFKQFVEFDQYGTPVMSKNALAIKTLLDLVKVELNEPTSYVKNDNLNKNTDLNSVLKELKDETDVN
jgi:hypothetical protein